MQTRENAVLPKIEWSIWAYFISEKGVEVDPKKVRAIKEWQYLQIT